MKRLRLPFDPDYVVAPGDTLREWWEKRSLPAEHGERVGLSVDTLRGIMDGSTEITPEIAARLKLLTGIGELFWLALEHNYRVGLAAGKTRVGS